MVIYIYGSETFKKDIHSVLNHSNIKFRLDEHGEIKDLKNLNELKDAIEDNPNNIYLIDDSKIIKKNSLNQKIKFLKPKDGIEQEYLLDNGIGDMSVDSIDELSKHIIKKLESLIDEKESSEIQNSIVEIVEDAYEKNEDSEEYIQLDDELSELLSHVDDSEEDNKEFENDYGLEESVFLVENEEENNDTSNLDNLDFEQDLDNIKEYNNEELLEPKEDKNDIVEITQGDNNMVDEFSQFDMLNEDEILAALDGMDGVDTSVKPISSTKSQNTTSPSSNESLNLNGSNVNDIAELISKLLNNKTLEITVKVKD